MASASISELIMFIAAVTVAAGVATTLTLNVTDISHSLDQRSLDLAADIDTDITIISDAGSVDAIYDGASTVTVLVKNTGDRTLTAEVGHVDVLVDGRYVVPTSVENKNVASGSEWKRGDVVELTVTAPEPLDAGAHRVTVLVDGDSDVIEFEAP